MSDEEMDREWKSNRRPQSTMARSFSNALNDLFKIDNSLADLDAAVEEKKRAVSTQTSELRALEAQIKATEERLKQRQSMSLAMASNSGSPSPRHRVPVTGTLEPRARDGGEQLQRNSTSHSGTASRPKTPTRPGTSRRPVPSYTAPPMPGALPPTPGASEGEYETIRGLRIRNSADYVVVDKEEDFQEPQHRAAH